LSADRSRFDGLAAVVTGGASGIGLATARLLAARGAAVAVLDRDLDGLPDGLHGVRADVTDDGQVRAAIEQAVASVGRLDVLVNNAGIGAQGTWPATRTPSGTRCGTSTSSASSA
jgi:2-keto-3-deoxy-L-fuconate dehydrogenase